MHTGPLHSIPHLKSSQKLQISSIKPCVAPFRQFVDFAAFVGRDSVEAEATTTLCTIQPTRATLLANHHSSLTSILQIVIDIIAALCRVFAESGL